jgi:hypothetical protein
LGETKSGHLIYSIIASTRISPGAVAGLKVQGDRLGAEKRGLPSPRLPMERDFASLNF